MIRENIANAIANSMTYLCGLTPLSAAGRRPVRRRRRELHALVRFQTHLQADLCAPIRAIPQSHFVLQLHQLVEIFRTSAA